MPDQINASAKEAAGECSGADYQLAALRQQFRDQSAQLAALRDRLATLSAELETSRALAQHEAQLRQAAEAELHTSQSVLEEAQDLGRVSTWYFDLASRTAVWSKQAFELFGVDPQTTAPSYEAFISTVHPDDRESVIGITRAMELEGKPMDVEFRVVHADGSVRWIHNRGVLLRDAAGRPLRLQGFNQDITERKRAEEEHARLEAQLRQAQKMEAIGTLAGGIAHDFNNMLYAIIGFAELVRDSLPADASARDDQQEVLNAARRASDLVQHILAFSRQSKSDPRPVKVATIAREVLRLMRASLPTTISIAHNFEQADCLVQADPTQLHQVLMNLCTNAGQAMLEQGGKLELGLRLFTVEGGSAGSANQQLAPGDYVLLSVRDTGNGIPPEIIERIFDPFFTTKAVGAGTGLGLSTVHGIVSSIGGRVSVYSELGTGTVFHVYLPCSSSPCAQPGAPRQSLPGGTERVLFVDDEPSLARMGKEILTRLGYEVVVAEGGQAAWEAFSANPESYDIVVTDQTMPGLTGIELAARVLQLRPQTPVLLCTGFSHVVSEESARKLGVADYLLKPVSGADVANAVRGALDRAAEANPS